MSPSEIAKLVQSLASALTAKEKIDLIGLVARGLTEMPTKAPEPVAQPINPGAVVIPGNTVCTCSKCQKPVYQTIGDVYENMSTRDFIALFEPLSGAPQMTKETKLWADPQGNIAINCPLCKGEYTLWIKGEGASFSEIPDGDADRVI